jgi:dipeptidyl aminopeptidase/acylaminoacyl peptidase
MLMHGENDNDVPIAEAEQFFIALKDVGTEAVFVRYPREGHGIRETKHVIDWTDRSITLSKTGCGGRNERAALIATGEKNSGLAG